MSDCTPACSANAAVPLPPAPPAYAPGTGGTAVAPPAPAISQIVPTAQALPSGRVLVNIEGSGFTSNSIIKLNGVAVPTTFLGSNRVQGWVLPLAAGTYNVLVHDTGGDSNTKPFEFYTPVVPAVTGIAPPTATVASAPVHISINGTGFSPASLVLVNGEIYATSYVSPSQVRTVLNGPAGTYLIQVQDRGGTSNSTVYTLT